MKKKLKEHHKKILVLSSEGYTNHEIAEELEISVNTVKYHKKVIYKKLKVSSISEALKIAFELELL